MAAESSAATCAEHSARVVAAAQTLLGYQLHEDDLANGIAQLSAPELALLFKHLWCYGSRRRFCQLYNINEGNFSRWLGGKRNSQAAENAVLSFLIYGPLAQESIPKPPPPATGHQQQQQAPKKRVVVVIRREEQSKRSDASSTGDLCSVEEALQKLEERAGKEEPLKVLLLVDGDHAAHMLPQLRVVAPAEPEASWSVHVMVVLARGHAATHVYPFKGRRWFTPVRTATNDKDATDHVLTWIASWTCCMGRIKREGESLANLLVLLLSADSFASETLRCLELCGRKAIRLSTEVHLGSWILCNLQTDQVASGQHRIHMESLRQVADECARRVDPYGRTAVDYVKNLALLLPCEAEKQRIKLRGVSPSELAFALAKCRVDWASVNEKQLRQPSSALREAVNAMGDEDLRTEFRLRWNGSAAEFCAKRSGIDYSNFNSWLARRLQSDQASSNAVRAWLQSLTSTNE